MSDNIESKMTVASDSGKLTCTFSVKTAEDMLRIFGLDIAKEVKSLLNDEEALGYLPGEYTFSFENKHLSVHHTELKSEIKNTIMRILKKQTYEKNDSSTRMIIKSDIDNYLNLLREKHAIYAYNVICDETNNTPDVIDRNEILCRVGIKYDNTPGDDKIVIIDFKISPSKEDINQ